MFAQLFFAVGQLTAKAQMAHIAISNTVVLGASTHPVGQAMTLPGIPTRCDIARKGKPVIRQAAGEAVGTVSWAPLLIGGLVAALVVGVGVPPVRKWVGKHLGLVTVMLIGYGVLFGVIMSLAPNTPKC